MNGKLLCIRNLPPTATDGELAGKFGQCGTVILARIMLDQETGRSKGFGLIEMASRAEASAAVHQLNYTNYDGRVMSVRLAAPADIPAEMPAA